MPYRYYSPACRLRGATCFRGRPAGEAADGGEEVLDLDGLAEAGGGVQGAGAAGQLAGGGAEDDGGEGGPHSRGGRWSSTAHSFDATTSRIVHHRAARPEKHGRGGSSWASSSRGCWTATGSCRASTEGAGPGGWSGSTTPRTC